MCEKIEQNSMQLKHKAQKQTSKAWASQTFSR